MVPHGSDLCTLKWIVVSPDLGKLILIGSEPFQTLIFALSSFVTKPVFGPYENVYVYPFSEVEKGKDILSFFSIDHWSVPVELLLKVLLRPSNVNVISAGRATSI